MLTYPKVIIFILQFSLFDGIAGDLKVTLLVFSGRQDPEWTVLSSGMNYKGIQKLLSDATINGFVYHPDGMPDKLGYRGFLVQDTVTMKEQLIVGPETEKLQLLLLSTIPEGLLPSGNIQRVKTEIKTGKVKVGVTGKRSKRDALPFNGGAWNKNERIRNCNNCYNYATNIRTDTMAQPGMKGGIKLPYKITDENLKAAASADGLQVEPMKFPEAPKTENTHLVALYVDKEQTGYSKGDFHFYRFDKDMSGMYIWSHKLSRGHATQKDFDKELLTSLTYANTGDYKFVTFMTCNRDKVEIEGFSDCKYK